MSLRIGRKIYYCLFMTLRTVLQRQKRASVRLDPSQRAICRDGHQYRLQFKTWQVLCRLLDARPGIVSRTDLVRDIWSGQDFTGEKGLNQSLWTIRNALGDDARGPRYVETVPRKGYRWIGPDLRRRRVVTPMFVLPKQANRGATALAGLSALLLIFAAGHAGWSVPDNNRFAAEDGSGQAYFAGRDIIVERPSAPRYILSPSGTKYFSGPTFSRDGSKLAFHVIHNRRCEMVVLELTSRRIDKFADCPSRSWSITQLFGA